MARQPRVRSLSDPKALHRKAAGNRRFVKANSATMSDRVAALLRLREQGFGPDGYPADYAGPKQR
jgi:hypothetical protein